MISYLLLNLTSFLQVTCPCLFFGQFLPSGMDNKPHCKIMFLVIERHTIVPIRVRRRIVDIERKSTNQKAVIRIATKASETLNYYPKIFLVCERHTIVPVTEGRRIFDIERKTSNKKPPGRLTTKASETRSKLSKM